MSDSSLRSRRRSLAQWALILVVGTSVIATWRHWTLMGLLATVAAEEFPDGVGPQLVHWDSLEKLNQRPASFLASYLAAPWAEWRAVVCQSLAYEPRRRECQWQGVPAQLAEVALTDSNPRVRELAYEALKRTCSLAPEDIPAILQQIESVSPGSERNKLLRVAVASTPTCPQCRALLLRMRDSQHSMDRYMAIELLAVHHPEEAMSASQLEELIARSPSGVLYLIEPLSRVARARPGLLHQLLDGSAKAKTLAMQALGASLRHQSPSGPLDPTLVAKAEIVAEQSFASGDGAARCAALNLLEYSPEGGHVLLRVGLPADPKLRQESLTMLGEIAWRYRRESADSNFANFQFTTEEADTLVELLKDSDPKIRGAAAHVLDAGIHSFHFMRSPFPAEGGPRNPGYRDLFRSLLQEPTVELSGLALNYFVRIAPFEESEIELIAAAIRRDSGSSWPSRLAFTEMQRRFPNHPQTRLLKGEVGASPHPALAMDNFLR